MTEGNCADSDLESLVTEIMAKNPKGTTNKILQDTIPSVPLPKLVECLNKLIAQNKIQILMKGKQLVYVLKDLNIAKKCQSGDIEEKIIFEIIERAGNNGITPKDIKFSSNLPQTHVTKMLKSMESKKLIKCVTAASKKKLYMLFDMEPSSSVTGGTFYSGQEFESEFVDVLSEQCFRYLMQARTTAEKLSDPLLQRNASFKSSQEISDYICSLKISKVKLGIQDIETILESLVYDGKIEKSITSHDKGPKKFYKATKPLTSSIGLLRMPCGVCHVYNDCYKGGAVSPSTCVYMKEWLQF